MDAGVFRTLLGRVFFIRVEEDQHPVRQRYDLFRSGLLEFFEQFIRLTAI